MRTGFLTSELTHHGSAADFVSYEDFHGVLSLTSNIPSIENRLAVAFNQEHNSAGTVVCLWLSESG